MDYYLGQIILFAGNFVPAGFAPCDGQTVPVNGNEALYALIGTTYGGDQVNFKLPDLRGRVPLNRGQGVTDPRAGGGSALTNHVLGQIGGTETVTLTQAQIPPHTHTFFAANAPATSNLPSNNMLATVPAGSVAYVDDQPGGPTPTSALMGMDTIANNGGSSPHANVMPVQAITYIICTRGIFPDLQ